MDVACYLCTVYKATHVTSSGVAVCASCYDGLKEEAGNGDEFVKDEEKTPTLFKGRNVKLSVNGKTVEGSFNDEILWPPGIALATRYPDVDFDDENCCSDPDYCDCEASDEYCTSVSVDWSRIEPDNSEIAIAMREAAIRFEKAVFGGFERTFKAIKCCENIGNCNCDLSDYNNATKKP